jgi:hypothetical protein
MKTVFITRVKNKDEVDKFISGELMMEVQNSRGIEKIYIVSNFEDENYQNSNLIPIEVVKDNEPISPTSINNVLRKIGVQDKEDRPDAFLAASKEVVGLKRQEIRKLIRRIQPHQKDLLVAGYKFKIKDNEFLDRELQSYYANKNLIAYQVPWNTCAIWNYQLFDKYVSKFDEITNVNPFNSVRVCIDNVVHETDYRGMEDGLAIAQAVSNKKLRFELIDDPLLWEVKPGDNNILSHRKKLARKDIVLRNFMAVRNYPVQDLLHAKIK